MADHILVPGKRLSEYSAKELTITILKLLAVGAAVALILSSPYGAQRLLSELKAYNARERYRVRKTLSSLSKRGLIRTTGVGDRRALHLTPKGSRLAEYDALRIRPVRWDGKWRVFMFDIPEKKKPARVALSRKVLDMGMRHFQKSVFVSPFPCEKELWAAATYHRVQPCIRMVTAESITDELYFKKEFGL